MKVEMIKYPTQDDWNFTYNCTLNTIGKKIIREPTDDWKVKLLESEHSPIETLWFAFKMEIPYWVSVHYVRHKIGISHFVQSQRNDRQEKYDRNIAPQGELVSHIMYVNARELVQMAHKRLCQKASKETREVMQKIVELVIETNPEFKSVLVPLCQYRNGKCTEFLPCNKM
jgi:thymidylate synthase ThyX